LKGSLSARQLATPEPAGIDQAILGPWTEAGRSTPCPSFGVAVIDAVHFARICRDPFDGTVTPDGHVSPNIPIRINEPGGRTPALGLGEVGVGPVILIIFVLVLVVPEGVVGGAHINNAAQDNKTRIFKAFFIPSP